MIVVVLLTIATGAVLLWALYTEQVPPPRSHQGQRWAGLPRPADIRRRDFPLVVAGYDPRVVDAHLRAVAQAYDAVRAQLPADDAMPAGPVPPEEGPDRQLDDPDQPSHPRAADAWAPPAMAPGPSPGSDAGGSSPAGMGAGSDEPDSTPDDR